MLGVVGALMSEDLQRTFVRHKHRLTVTSPSLVPIWLPRQAPENQPAIEDRFARGFGIIDWKPGRSAEGPQLILWPAARMDFSTYGTIIPSLNELLMLLVEATMRWFVSTVPPMPFFIPSDAPLSDADMSALASLESSGYRLATFIRLFGLTSPSPA